jgi:hypothetical protein
METVKSLKGPASRMEEKVGRSSLQKVTHLVINRKEIIYNPQTNTHRVITPILGT